MSEQPDRLERELRAMLSVDPSPDLQARIRARAFSTPPKRTPWLAWASGLAAAAAVVVIAVNRGPTIPEVRPNPPAIAETREIPQPVAETKTRTRFRPSVKSPKEPGKAQPNAVLVSPQTASATLPAAEINLPALKVLDVTNWIQPIPQTPFSIAGFQEIKIEPPILTVPNLE